MRRTIRSLSLAFTAGAFGAFIYSVTAFFLGTYGVHRAFGVKLAYKMTPEALYPALVWGGLFALLLLVPILRSKYCIYRGIVLGVLLSLIHLLIIYPYMTNKGFLGLRLGTWTPAFVIFYNAVWGIFAAFWLDYTRERV
ncbi:MAG: hypothetical protein V3V95_00410 [Thermodesulfobacteriota bacterium]